MKKVKVGCVITDITPEIGVQLSGFVARMGKPSTGIADRLNLRVLTLCSGEDNYFLCNYDLVCIGESLKGKIITALAQRLGNAFSPERCILTTTHTHSGPTAMPLEGEIDAPAEYLDFLVSQTADAAEQSLNQVVPAKLEWAEVHVPGLTYNRRAVLADGRVSMTPEPDEPIVSRGSVDDRLNLFLWRKETGEPVAAIAHFACHGVSMMTQLISGDIPGELSRRIGHLVGAPCLFLQGTSGDTNPTVVAGERPPMLAWCDRFMQSLEGVSERFQSVMVEDVREAHTILNLEFEFPDNAVELEQMVSGWERIGQGESESPDLQPALRALSDLMNIKPGDSLDPVVGGFAAMALAGAGKRTLAVIKSHKESEVCPMPISVWALGNIRFVFLSGEMFTITGMKIRRLDETKLIIPITYSAPVLGYIPDRDSIQHGGYEVDFAWRFTRQPGPFAVNTEERIVSTVGELIASLNA